MDATYRHSSHSSAKKKPPAVAGRGLVMVEAAGQLICLFRGRLDYAFTPVP
jgi:hypothetical protein